MESSLTSHSRPPHPVALILVRLFFTAWLLTQLVVPLWQRRQDHHPTRFGWEMFSSVAFAPIVELELVDGSVDTANVGDYLAVPRLDLDYGDADWRPVCERSPHPVRLRLVYRGARPSESFECPVD